MSAVREVEVVQPAAGGETVPSLVRIEIARPPGFDNLNRGDSVAVNGVCLTIEELSETGIQFALAKETLERAVPVAVGSCVNLERSLRLGERNHGHTVTGHVDCKTDVIGADRHGEVMTLRLRIPGELRAMVWTKGSIALNGVSLTVNRTESTGSSDGTGYAEVCLIPETLKRTNLGRVSVGNEVNLEVDFLARAMASQMAALFEARLPELVNAAVDRAFRRREGGR